MTPLLCVLQICVSIVLLWKGSDILVENAVKIAAFFGVSHLVIGLTIVALGTSAPEFSVTIGAAITGQSNISVSNVIGSNIFNLGFILGGIAIIRTIKSSPKLILRDGSILIIATIAILVMVWDRTLVRYEGIILFAGLIFYNVMLMHSEKRSRGDIPRQPISVKNVLGFLLGLALILAGGSLLRNGSVGIARLAGMSEWVIGATIVAAGTSAPEFVTSLAATVKGHHELSAGNLVGSCIYNFMGVLGTAVIIRPMQVTSSARQTMLFTVILMIVAIIMLGTHKKLTRTEGIVLFIFSIIIWVVEFM